MKFKTPTWSERIQQPQYIIMGLILLMILWMFGSAVVSTINHRMVGKMEVASTVTDINFVTYAFVDPIEDVIVPDVSGRARPSLRAGERTAKNERVLEVDYERSDNGADQESQKYFYAPIAGLISYDLDGYERLEDPQELIKVDMKSLYEDELSRKKADPARRTQANTPYAKVVDNLASARLVFPYYPDRNDIFQEVGDVFRMRFPDFDATTVAQVEDILSINAEKSLAVVRLGPMSDEFLQTRFVKCEPYRVEAALIPLAKDAIVYREETPGIYILTSRVVTWTPASIEDEDQEFVYIKPPLEGTIIITTPKRVQAGEYLSS